MREDDDRQAEKPWAELNRTQRSLAIKRLGGLSHPEIGKRLGVSAQSIQVHVSKYGAQHQLRRDTVHNGKPENIKAFEAKTATYAQIRKALLRETRPDGTPYELADVLVAMGPNRDLTPARHPTYNLYQCQFLHLLKAGRLP